MLHNQCPSNQLVAKKLVKKSAISCKVIAKLFYSRVIDPLSAFISCIVTAEPGEQCECFSCYRQNDMMNTKSLKPCNVTWILGAQYMIYTSHIQAGYFSREVPKKRGK